MLKIKKIKTEMFNQIEHMVVHKKCSYIDAVILYCEQNNVEPEQAARIISSNELILAKIQFEAEDLNMIKKANCLPV